MKEFDWLSHYNREEEGALEAGDRLYHVLRPRRVSTVLDAAAGLGLRALALARAGYDVVACEADETLFTRAAERFAEASDATVPLYRLGLRGVREVAEGPFDAVLALEDAVARWPSQSHTSILRALAGQLVPSGYLVIGLRDWDAQLRTQEYFEPRQVTRMNGTRLIMFDVWEYGVADGVTATTFYLYTRGERWRVETTKTTYYPVHGDEFQTTVEQTGFTLVELIEHPKENWWILRKGNRRN